MKKIKVRQNEEVIEGSILDRNVKPFGSSSHVVLSKGEIGKYVQVVIPKNPMYSWLLSENERREVVAVCNKILKSKKSKGVENIKNTKFSLEDVEEVIKILNGSKKHLHIVDKLRKTYKIK